ncbi:MAG: peptidoglycan-binding protein [Acidimicrobiia bacterium]|nr:peptidoglycan-binding protein [Acidimicrobiia bacterium]
MTATNENGTEQYDGIAEGSDRRRASTQRTWSLAVTVLAALAVIAAAAVARGGPDDGDTTEASATTTAVVTRGDLSTSDRLDGTVERSTELVIVHRISGQSPGAAVAGSSNAGAGSAGGPAGAGATFGASATAAIGLTLAAGIAAVLTTADGTGDTTGGESSTSGTDPTTTSTTATVETPTTTPGSSPSGPPSTDAGSVPSTNQDSCPDETDSSTSTTIADSTTTSPTNSTSEPTTTTTDSVPPDCGSTSTTTPQPDQGFPSGGGGGIAGPGGGAAPSGGGFSDSAGGATASATIAVETVTSTRSVGDEIRSGDFLYSVDGRPVVALVGAVPAWRDMNTDAEDGVDILQLETALAALGYDADGDMSIDETFDFDTATAVAAWQQGLGLEGTGEVVLGSVVFIPETAVVTAVTADVGGEVGDGDPILRLGLAGTEVVAVVPAERRALVTPGLAVDVAGAAGIVTRLVSSSTDSDVEVIAHVSVEDDLSAGAGEEVTVRFTITDATNVLLLPVEAVASRIDGSYAVQVVRSETDTENPRWTPVTVVAVSNGQVALVGDDLDDGTVVIRPG